MTSSDEKPPRGRKIDTFEGRVEIAKRMLDGELQAPTMVILGEPEFIGKLPAFPLPDLVPAYPEDAKPRGWTIEAWVPWRVYRTANETQPLTRRAELREGDTVFIQEPFASGYRRMTVRASRTTARGRYLEDASLIVLLSFRKKWGWCFDGGFINRKLWDSDREIILHRVPDKS